MPTENIIVFTVLIIAIMQRYVRSMKQTQKNRLKAQAIAISRQQLDARLCLAISATALFLSLLLLGAGRLVGP